MVFDLNETGSSTFYVNISTVGDGKNTKFCEATQLYNTPIIKEADQYMMSLERCTIPLQGIKLFNDIDTALSFVDKGDGNTKSHNLQNIYNLHDFLQAINNFDDQNNNKIQVYLKTSGRLVLKYDHYNTHNIVLSDELKYMFDLNLNTLTSDDASVTLIGASSCINRIDYLKRIILVTRDLPTISEYNGRVKLKTVTSVDYSPQITFSVNGGNNSVIDDNYSMNVYPRDNLVLEPHYSRLINLSGAQVTSINLIAYAEVLNFKTLQTEILRISLRPFSIFSAKLQFHRKKISN